MRFLIISEGGDGIGIATRLQAEGNEVKIWIRDTEAEKRGEGIIEHTHDNSWGEVVVADCTGAGPLLDHMVELGGYVVGGSSLCDRLESDRSYANQVMKECSILTPKARSFTDWESAIEFINESDDTLVFKPEGRMSGVIPSYCPSSNAELLESIEHFKHLAGSEKPEFTLQEFIEGTCVSTEAWFDGEKFLYPFNHTIERKHFMVGDVGPSGGCTGNAVWTCDDDPIVRETVLKLEDFLVEHQYRGAIDVNAVVNEEGVYALEFTPRFGYDALPTYLYTLYGGDFGALLWGIAHSDCPDTMDCMDGFGAGVRLSLPPWPTEKYSAEHGVPIRGVTREECSWKLYPYEIESQDGALVTSGGYGIVGVMNAYGETVDEAFETCYKMVKKVKIPDVQYRTDLAEVCSKDYRKLKRLVNAYH